MAPKPRPALTVCTKTVHSSRAEQTDRVANTPKGCTAKLTPPRDLSPEARKEWNRVVRLYRQLNLPILNDLDLNLLAAYCTSCAIFHDAQRQLQEADLTVFGANGEPKPNPLLAIIEKQGKLLAKYVEQLCLSPVGRARYALEATKAQRAADQEQEASMESFLQRAGR